MIGRSSHKILRSGHILMHMSCQQAGVGRMAVSEMKAIVRSGWRRRRLLEDVVGDDAYPYEKANAAPTHRIAPCMLIARVRLRWSVL